MAIGWKQLLHWLSTFQRADGFSTGMPAIVADLPPSAATLAPDDRRPGLDTVACLMLRGQVLPPLLLRRHAQGASGSAAGGKDFVPTGYVVFDWPFVRLNAALIPVAEVTLLVESCC